MPLYEYQCDACERRFELIRKYSDPPVEVCPTCGGVVHKLASSPAIQFKGSGFYITDYAKKSNAPAGESQNTKDTKDSKDSKESGTKDSKDSSTKDTKSSEKSGEKAEKSTSTSETKSESKPSSDPKP